ncbi:YibE/F family protein [Corynebacterium sp. YIM 101645]|uniref:YibE/F family protein n=1 Tax=Corynebacterium lemuris TaxID=1859292 RepID=A0ABT2FZ94_9CORY|nr:YibE/F family protein [Corynebacterium lemuris]MCS5480556.1 YibE/F family protein [Corynebacterium lemuris]
MGRHQATGTPPATSPWRWALLGFLAVAVLTTLVGLWRLWPPTEAPNVSEDFATTFNLNHTQVTGTVTLADAAACASPSTGTVFDGSPLSPPGQEGIACERSLVEITSGQNEGRRTQLVHYGMPGEPRLAEGDRIMLAETPTPEGPVYSFSDYQRTVPLVTWGVVIALMIVVFAAWRGFRALIGLVITMVGIGVFLLPALLHGGSPLGLALVAGSAILIIVVPLVHGVNWKSASALGGTLIALGIAAGLAQVAIDTSHLRGLGSDDNLNILLYLPEVSIIGLLLCGFIIGALGVLNDVTIAQASTVTELADLDPEATPWRLFLGAMKVGRDHIASMVYTLVLSYTGASLPMLLLLSVAERPLSQTLTSDVVATELLRSGIGALALTMAVPLTTLIAAWTVREKAASAGSATV